MEPRAQRRECSARPVASRGYRLPRCGRLIPSDDSGATLIIALIVITVVAIVVGSVLILSGTNERTTVALREQASVAAAADGATQVATNQLRTASNTLVNFGCSPGSTAPVGLLDMTYPATGTAAGGSAHVTCTTDIDGSETGFLTEPNAGPGSALLSLGKDSNDAITVEDKRNGSNDRVTVDGGVFSNTNLSVTENPLQNVWAQPAPPDPKPANWNPMSWMIARDGDSLSPTNNACSNVALAHPEVVYNNCNFGDGVDVRGIDPGTLVPKGTTSYNPSTPSASPADPTVTTACYTDPNAAKGLPQNVWVVTVTPQKSIDGSPAATIGPSAIAAINGALAASNTCKSAPTLVNITAGWYYLTTSWDVTASYYVVGTINPAFGSPTNYSKVIGQIIYYYFPYLMPNKGNGNAPGDLGSVCIDPQDAAHATTGSGAEFFIQPGGQLYLNDASNSHNSDGVQMVMCASKSDAGPPVAIYSQRSDVQTFTPGESSGQAIYTANSPSLGFTLQGTIYTPGRGVTITMNNGSAKQFAYGIFAKSIDANINSSAKSVGPVSIAGGIPEGGGSPIPVYVFLLKTYVCPGQDSCDASGSVALTARVRVSGYVHRTVTVLSWSVNR